MAHANLSGDALGCGKQHILCHVGGNQKNNMNTLEIKGDWNIAKGKLRQKWGGLTDNDLEFVQGQDQELYGRIQKRTGATREAVEKAVKEVLDCQCK